MGWPMPRSTATIKELARLSWWFRNHRLKPSMWQYLRPECFILVSYKEIIRCLAWVRRVDVDTVAITWCYNKSHSPTVPLHLTLCMSDLYPADLRSDIRKSEREWLVVSWFEKLPTYSCLSWLGIKLSFQNINLRKSANDKSAWADCLVLLFQGRLPLFIISDLSIKLFKISDLVSAATTVSNQAGEG